MRVVFFLLAAIAVAGCAELPTDPTNFGAVQYIEECYPTPDYDCGGGPEGGDPCPGCTGIVIGGAYTASQCINTGTDADSDSIWDECEYQLAYAFRPAF